jgi:hypothetical protein
MIYADVPEHNICSILIGGVSRKTNFIPVILPVHTAYEDGTECSETSAYKIQAPGITKKKEYKLADDTTKDLTEHGKKNVSWMQLSLNKTQRRASVTMLIYFGLHKRQASDGF